VLSARDFSLQSDLKRSNRIRFNCLGPLEDLIHKKTLYFPGLAERNRFLKSRPWSAKRVSIDRRPLTMNILRTIFAVLAIVLLIVSTVSTLDPGNVQFAILPLVCFFFGYVVSYHFPLDDSSSAELAIVSGISATRAPPL
jgi:hypothetical protein